MRLFTQASALDPDYASAYAMTMWCHAARADFGMVKDIEQERSEVTRLWRMVRGSVRRMAWLLHRLLGRWPMSCVTCRRQNS